MIVWHSPQTQFWIAARCFRRSPHPESIRSAMTAILDFSTRSDRLGVRARELLANIRFGTAGDAETPSQSVYIGQDGRSSLRPSRFPGHSRTAQLDKRIAQAKRCLSRQAALVDKSSLSKCDATLAVALLQTMQATLQLMLQSKHVLLRDLDRAG
jgi:hypothetical protein